ncbi:MAG: galactokinase family protein [Candidatus Bathyarchaeia archaeon]
MPSTLEALGPGPWTVASAPGRIDFLNTHQDYKGLPVVPVAINLRTYLLAKPNHESVIRVKSLDLCDLGEPYEDEFKLGLNVMLHRGWFGNYLRGVVNVIAKRGDASKLQGLDVLVRSEIPIGSGLSSSAALEVGFLTLLNHAFSLGYEKAEVADMAYRAETEEAGIPCGRLDQYGVTYGGVVKVECRPPYEVEALPFKDLTFTVIDSGIRHSTAEIHPYRQADIDRGLKTLMENPAVPQSVKQRMGYRYYEPDWRQLSEEELKPYLDLLDEKARSRLVFTFRMQKSTEVALKALRLEEVMEEEATAALGAEAWSRVEASPAEERTYTLLGEVMNYQHSLLRCLYDVSLPELERIRESAVEAGAYGAKLSGAGLGGSIIALAKNPDAGKRLLEAGLNAGGRQGWVSAAAQGASIEQR